MDVRQYFPPKRTRETEAEVDKTSAEDISQATGESSSKSCSQTQGDAASTSHDLLSVPPHSKRQHLSASEKRKQYKAKLSYKREWEAKYPWVSCEDVNKGMFCTICQKWGKPTPGSRGAWTSKGITDWSHATELLWAHGESQCHRDAAVTASMAQQAERGKSILELQCSAAAKEAACRAERNCEILLKLLRSIYFLAKNKIVHTTVYPDLLALQGK